MRVVLIPTAEAVVDVNKYVCEQGGNPHHCIEIGKVESAITTAFLSWLLSFCSWGIITRCWRIVFLFGEKSRIY